MDEETRVPYFFLGLGLGVAVGMLFAPKAGSEARDYLMGKAGEGKDLLRRGGEQIRDTAGDVLDKGRDLVSKQRDQFSQAVEAGKQAYRDTINQTGNAGTGGAAPEGV